MKSKWKKRLLIAAVVLLPLWVFSGPPLYWAKEIRGRVVDAETGAPVAGAVVVARWVLFWPGPAHGGHGGALNTVEVTTDKDGMYSIPSWGPRPSPPIAYLDYMDPEIRLFKSNYYPEILSNTVVIEHRSRSWVRSSEWDGKTIPLKPFKNNDWSDFAFRLTQAWSDTGDCLRECPNFILALDAETRRIQKSAPNGAAIPFGITIDNLDAGDRDFLLGVKK